MWGEATATEVADREPCVVADDGAAESEQGHQDDAEAAGARIHGTQDEDGLAGDGESEVLEQHQPGDRQVAVTIQRRFERVQGAR
jgi:hypothetical protein